MPRITGQEKTPFGYASLTVPFHPGAVAANTSIALPEWAKGVQRILAGLHVRKVDHTHDVTHKACAATSAAYASDTAITSTTATPVQEVENLAVVTGTPAAGEVQLYDEDNVRLGRATVAGDILILMLLYRSFTVEV